MPAILRTIHTAEDTSAKVDAETMARMLRFALSLVRSVGTALSSPKAGLKSAAKS